MHSVVTAPIALLVVTAGSSLVHEKRHEAIENDRRRMEPQSIIPVRIALRQDNLDAGYEQLMDISHPESANYGKHWTKQEVHDYFAPGDDSIDVVKQWLTKSGIDHEDILHYDNKGWLAFDTTVEKAEHLFETEYFEHDVLGDTRIGCDGYSLPEHISQHVDFVKPGVVMSAPMTKRTVLRQDFGGELDPHASNRGDSNLNTRSPDDSLQNCGYNITPPCIRALYKIPQATDCSSGNELGIFERADKFAQADLDLFFKHFAAEIPEGTTPEVLPIDGGTAPAKPGSYFNSGESDVDLELAYSLVYPEKVVVYQVDDDTQAAVTSFTKGFGQFNTFLDAIDGSYCNYTAYGVTGDDPVIDPQYPDPKRKGYKGERMCGTYELTRVLSISYAILEELFPVSYLRRQCDEFMKLALQGHTILVASGDYGVVGSFFNPIRNKKLRFSCITPHHFDRVHRPTFPSTCPFVTSVGGTRLYDGQTVGTAESVMEVNLTALPDSNFIWRLPTLLDYFSSGGGFSNYFSRPLFQDQVVPKYLDKHVKLPSYVSNADASNFGEGGVYNRAGRGFPDVAANGAQLLFYNDKRLEPTYGTSLSTPIFASIITLINEERTKAGKSPVGFINPVIYQHPEVFDDIKNGSNYNCVSPGFKATEGWDAVTGLGTPNFPKMLDLFMSLP